MADDQDLRDAVAELKAHDRARQAELEELRNHQRFVDRLSIDNDGATRATQKSLDAAQVELQAQTTMLMSAMTKFQSFVNLPPTADTSVWSLVFDVVALAVPALGLLKFLKTEEQLVSAAAAVELAAKLGSKQAKAIKLSRSVAELNESVIKREKEAIERIKQQKEASEAAEMGALSRLDGTRGPIATLRASAVKARDIRAKALDALHDSFAQRLTDPQKQQKETLEQMANRLMPIPPSLSDAELDQVEKLYLWEMIAAWVRQGNVKQVTTITIVMLQSATNVRTMPPYVDVKTVGINDNQLATLVNLFGPKVPRGPYFYKPFVQQGYAFFAFCGPIQVETVTKYENNFTMSARD